MNAVLPRWQHGLFGGFAASQRISDPTASCFLHRLFAMDVDLSRYRQGGGTGHLRFVATVAAPVI
ncbi:hypothetical protein DF223_10450 [Mycetocola zhujimingii]|uniref:Uncharacterized protein n=1 Tax=Mycetocola zhujimingii TaxID=2079792 RepID=A0A2U1TCP9_9MICO|nr:hypothetical protein DF223_10450 [Mycetocola zhujimingii]